MKLSTKNNRFPHTFSKARALECNYSVYVTRPCPASSDAHCTYIYCPWGSLYTDIMASLLRPALPPPDKLDYSASEYHTYMLLKTVSTPTPATYLHYTSPVCMNQRVQGKCKATPTRTTALGVTQLPGQLSRQQGSSLQHNTCMFFSLE